MAQGHQQTSHRFDSHREDPSAFPPTRALSSPMAESSLMDKSKNFIEPGQPPVAGPNTTHGTAIYADQLTPQTTAMYIGIYGSPMECLGGIYKIGTTKTHTCRFRPS